MIEKSSIEIVFLAKKKCFIEKINKGVQVLSPREVFQQVQQKSQRASQAEHFDFVPVRF